MPRDGNAGARAEPVEGPWELPDGWSWRRLGDLCTYVSRGRSPKYVSSDGVAVINQRCIRSGRIDFAHRKQTSRTAAASLSKDQHLRPGDILWNSTGTGTIGRAAIFPGADELFLVDSHVTVLRLRDMVPRWVEAWLSTPFVQERVGGIGSTQQVELSRDTVMGMPVPWVECRKQQEIIGVVDALFADIDEGERALAEGRAGVETYCKALLKAAVTGELTADWRRANPPAETGQDLLRRILADRRARWEADPKNRGKRHVEPAGPAARGLPELPASWWWTSLDQLSEIDPRNGLSIKEAASPTEVRALRLNALASDVIDWTQTRYLPRKLGEVAAYSLEDGDLLVSRANGSPDLVGRASLCLQPPGDIIFPDTAIRYRLGTNSALNRWIVAVWNSDFARQQLCPRAKTTAGILKVSQNDIKPRLL